MGKASNSLHGKCGRLAWVEYPWSSDHYAQHHFFPGLLCVPWPKYALILFSQFTLITFYSYLFLVSVCFLASVIYMLNYCSDHCTSEQLFRIFVKPLFFHWIIIYDDDDYFHYCSFIITIIIIMSSLS